MTKVLVGFGEDGTTGDSSFGPESYGEYVEGMTFDQAREVWAKGVMKDWSVDENEYSIDEFIEEEFFEEVAGFWVIDKKMYEAISNVDNFPGNDSAVYALINTLKTQIKNVADFTLTR